MQQQAKGFLKCCFVTYLCINAIVINAQKTTNYITLSKENGKQNITVKVGDQPFTTFIFPDSLEKPSLYPIYAPDGQIITRGFPLQPRSGEPVDHPHHFGLWFNYESVNGLDFWNNSFAIAPEKKHLYGWIKMDSIVQMQSGLTGRLAYKARWEDQQKNILLNENTTYLFKAFANQRIIDRYTTLTAQKEVAFKDVKDGLIALRIAHELQIPAKDTDVIATGNYLTSEGKTGNDVWGTRAAWCLLYGKMGNDTINIVIIDNPKNPGYPTYWHARGYGLFAANPLGEKVFSNGASSLNLTLQKGQAVQFRYRVVIASGKNRLSVNQINQLEKEFQKQ